MCDDLDWIRLARLRNQLRALVDFRLTTWATASFSKKTLLYEVTFLNNVSSDLCYQTGRMLLLKEMCRGPFGCQAAITSFLPPTIVLKPHLRPTSIL
jgi:hypothetical protein